MRIPSRLAFTIAAAVALLSLLAPRGETAPPETTPDPAPHEETAATETASVVLDGRELFRLRGVAALPAAVRARAVSERIAAIARDRSLDPQSTTTVPADGFVEIFVGPRMVVTVTDGDGALEGVDRAVAAKAIAMRVRTAIEAYRHERSAGAIVRGIATSVVVFAALALGLWLLGRIAGWIEAALERRFGERIRSLRLRSLPFVHVERLLPVARRVAWGVRFVGGIVAIVLAIEIALDGFPWTRPIARGIVSYITDPLRMIGLSVLGYVPKLVFLLVLAAVTWWALRLLKLFFTGIENGVIVFSNFYPEWAVPTYRLVRFLFLAFVVVVAYPYLPGSESAAFKGVSLFLGVMFSLGSSSAISNLIAGYSMTYRRAFRIGDRVQIGDLTGDVEQTRLLVTHLRSIKNEEIVIPNSVILNSSIVNFSSRGPTAGLVLHTTVGIGYEVPWRQVEAMLLDAAARTPGAKADPPPYVLQKSLGDFAVNYELNVFTDEPRRMAQTYTDLHRNIQDVFNEYGVQIMTPAYEGDPEQAKIVPKDQWYAAPARPPAGPGRSK